MTSAARDDKNRVVAAYGADRFGQLGPIERDRERLRLTDSRPNDNQLLDLFDPTQKLTGGALQRRQRRFGVRCLGVGPLIGAIAGTLHETELLDVPRDGRLRRVEAALVQAATELLLAIERFAIDQFEDDVLTARFHAFRP